MKQNAIRDLKGRTFLITRTVEGNRIEREKLEKLGAEVIELPLIEIGPPSDPKILASAIENIGQFDWIIFTSVNGVVAFFQEFSKSMNDKSADLRKIRFGCVGPETQSALTRSGHEASFVPKEFLTRKLGEEILEEYHLIGKRVLLARAEEASRELATILKSGGADVLDAPVYRTIPIKIRAGLVDGLLAKITDITLTSPSTVKSLVANVSIDIIKSRNIKVHCIGPVTGEYATKAGLAVDSVAKIHTIDGMIEAATLLR